MAWDGDWFGAWDGTWFGTESSPPSSISGITSGSGPRRSVTSDAASRASAWLPGQAPRTIDPGRGQRWMTVLNMSGEVIPAWSALEPYGVNGDGVILVRKPTVDDSPTAMLSSGSVIGIGDYGVGTNHMATWAYFHAADGTPAVGESLGTRSGQWKLYRGYEGFLVWGGSNSYTAGGNIIMVQRDVTCRNLSSGTYGYLYGSGGNGFCCRCRRFLCGVPAPNDFYGFPATLSATITVSCIGTRTITLTRSDGSAHGCNAPALTGGYFRAQYTGSYLDSTLGGGTYNECDSANSGAVADVEIERLAVYLWCCSDFNPVPSNDPVGTPTNPLGVECNGNGIWFGGFEWYKIVSGTTRLVRSRTRVVLGSCSPLMMSSGLMTVTCNKTIDASYFTPCVAVDNREAFTDCDECVGSDSQMDFNE